MSGIPVIDVSALTVDDTSAEGDVERRAKLVSEFAEAYQTIGFSYIVNHGIEEGLLDDVFEASRRFHGLPRETKMKLELNAANRGFLPINSSTDVNTELAEVTAPNQSESFLAMCEHGPDSPEIAAGDYLAGQNVWPEIPGFAETVMRYHQQMSTLASSMVGVAAEALGAEPSALVDHFVSPIASVRLLYYPPQPLDSPAGMFGSAPHCDFGCLTFLAQDGIGGLAVGTQSGDWIDVPPMEGAFIVNVGDMLRQWSNGQFLSTPHRVINRSPEPRYSIPFFFDPHPSTVIAPLKSCITPERPALYEPVLFGEFLRSELEAGFEHHSKFGRTADNQPSNQG